MNINESFTLEMLTADSDCDSLYVTKCQTKINILDVLKQKNVSFKFCSVIRKLVIKKGMHLFLSASKEKKKEFNMSPLR